MSLARDLRRGSGFSWLVIIMLALGVGVTFGPAESSQLDAAVNR